jgi:hypothetical protein
MKFILTILSILLLTTSIFCFPGGKTEKVISENTITSLLYGLESDNLGLKTSCIYMTGELKLTDAIIPLMKLLRNDENEEVRICSALALYKIGTPMSIFAVKQASIFDSSQRVVKLSSNFYKDYLRNNISADENNEDSTNVAAK